MTESKIYQKLKQSLLKIIARIESSEESGSGFLISSDGYILTCWHVIEAASEICVILPDQTSVTALYVGHDIKYDIALLKIEEKYLNDVPLGDANLVRISDEVVILGYPWISKSTTENSPSLLSSKVANITDNYIKIANPVGIGMSGAPAYHIASGTIIGIVAKELTYITISNEKHPTGGAGFVVPINLAHNLLNGVAGLNSRIVNLNYIEEFKQKVAGIYDSFGFDTALDVRISGQSIDIYATTSQGSAF